MTGNIRQISIPLAAAVLAATAMLVSAVAPSAGAASRPTMVTEKEPVIGSPKNDNQVLL